VTTGPARKTVTFTRPFNLTGIDGVQPAGAYEVFTDEELIDDLSFVAYRRVATAMHLRGTAPSVSTASIRSSSMRAFSATGD
jgi:hypothetical protein